MADQDYLHTTQIIKAALPYIEGSNRLTAELFVKAFDLIGSLNSMKNSNDLAACGFTAGKIDFEGLLTGIRPVCNKKEREFIDRILGFFNMKRMFETYNNIMETMKTMQEFGGFPFGDTGSEADTDSVMGNFANSNFESIFNSFQNSSGFSNSSASGNEEQNQQASETDQASTSGQTQADHMFSGMKGGMQNDMMLEMLKAMVPPDQVSTFENLSMLLKTMSYDNNNKPDDNKEHSDV